MSHSKLTMTNSQMKKTGNTKLTLKWN